jgi:hypothetical protein
MPRCVGYVPSIDLKYSSNLLGEDVVEVVKEVKWSNVMSRAVSAS